MSSFTSVRRALSAAILLIAFTNADQQCYYPDGTPSNDTPCGGEGASSCCGEGSFCMDNGLCYGGGLVSRGSCTDKSWASTECTGFCKTDDTHTNITLKPCSGGTFVCGLEAECSNQTAVFSMSGTGSIVLRPSQIESLAKPALSSLSATSTSTSSPHEAQLYTAGQMSALGLSLGLPLLCSLIACYLLYRRNPLRKPKKQKLMYTLPDNHQDYSFPRPPRPPLAPTLSRDYISSPAGGWSVPPVSRDGSDIDSPSVGDLTPVGKGGFWEREKQGRFGAMGAGAGAVELPAHPAAAPIVHEMGEGKR